MNSYIKYIQQRFPVFQNIIFAALITVALHIAVLEQNRCTTSASAFQVVLLIITVTLFMFLMRLFDDLKDVETDQTLFPERIVPSGGITTRRLWYMILTVHLIFVLPVVVFPEAVLWFFFALLFAWLTFRWFFAPNIISRKLLLAFVTHQPAGILVNLWVAAATANAFGFKLTPSALLPSIIFVAPVMLWEVSRKIKAQGCENEYITYSKVVGPLAAAAFLLIPAGILSGGLIFMDSSYSGNHPAHTIIQIALFVAFAVAVTRFLINPSQKNLILNQASILLSLLSIVVYLIFTIPLHLHF